MCKNAQIFSLLVLLVLFMAACGQIDEIAGQVSQWGSDGNLVGIIFKNGVECLGEEAQPLPSDVIYVSPEGDDTQPGTRDLPLGTLSTALCNLRPGQTLEIFPGEYHESVILGAFGDSSKPIIIRAHTEGASHPILDGESTRTMGMALVESTNIIIQGLEFRNYTDEGLLILDGSGISILNNSFTANGRASIDPDHDGEGFGVNVLGAENILVEGNLVMDNGPNQARREAYTLGTGINTFGNHNVIIRDNTVYNTIGGGILIEDSFDVLVENNRIERNELDANGGYWDGGIWVDGGHNITLRNNQIADNHGPGIVLSDEDVQYPGESFGYIVEENVLSGNIVGISIWNWGQCPIEDEKIIRLNDNRFSGNEEGDTWCVEWECGEGQPCN